MNYDKNQIVQHIKYLHGGEIFEVRLLAARTAGASGRDFTLSGYFKGDNLDALFQQLDIVYSASGVYVTLNAVNPACFARENQEIIAIPKATTADADIIRRTHLFIDFDAKRPSNTSSSDAEHKAALDRARAVSTYLQQQGFGAPVLLDSGNGAQLLYRCDLEVKDDRPQRLLQALAERFADEVVDVDISVHNPARIVRLAGTENRKGKEYGDRVYRFAKILEMPEAQTTVTAEILDSILPQKEQAVNTVAKSAKTAQSFDIDDFVRRHFPDAKAPTAWKDGRRWVLPVCPFNPEHNNGSAVIIEQASGAIGFTCHHNSCQGNDWQKLRELLEPGCYDRRNLPERDFSGLSANVEKQQKLEKSKPEPKPEPEQKMPEVTLEIFNKAPVPLQQYVAHIIQKAPYPNMTLALAGGLAFFSAVCGRHYELDGTHTNLYIFALAPSGSGKEFPRQLNKELAATVTGLVEIAGNIASAEALEDALCRSKKLLTQKDEVDSFFEKLKEKEGRGAMLNGNLLEYYSASTTVITPRLRAEQKDRRGKKIKDDRPPVWNASHAFFGTGVPEFFFNSVNARSLSDGFFSRFLGFVAEGRKLNEDADANRHIPAEIIGTLEALKEAENPRGAEQDEDEKNPELAAAMAEAREGRPAIIHVPFAPEAKNELVKIQQDSDQKSIKAEKSGDYATASIMNRRAEKVKKLALLRAVLNLAYRHRSDGGSYIRRNPPTVTADDLRWGLSIADYSGDLYQWMLKKKIAVSDTERDVLRVLDFIERNGGEVRQGKILKNLHLTARQFREIAETLLATEQAECVKEVNGGRPQTIWTLANKVSE